jgi:phosphoenolpyruvate carboxylase
LLDRLNPGLTGEELDTLWARVRLEITSIWQTEEHPREKLTVADEREHVLFYLIDILYRVVPHFYEEIEAALAAPSKCRASRSICRTFCASAPGSAATWTAIRTCTAKTIRETLQRHQQVIVSTYFAECGSSPRA